ncbi:MAG: hypothetical protein MPW15_26255 [Candidatus Manganitrophus sp.]|nr:hypothetical protein [Candidatus Manganitrophus sp.]
MDHIACVFYDHPKGGSLKDVDEEAIFAFALKKDQVTFRSGLTM